MSAEPSNPFQEGLKRQIHADLQNAFPILQAAMERDDDQGEKVRAIVQYLGSDQAAWNHGGLDLEVAQAIITACAARIYLAGEVTHYFSCLEYGKELP